MTPVRTSRLDADQAGRAAILAAVREGIILVGTARRLARSLRLTVRAFRAGLRELLEREQIAVTAEPRGQLTIRSTRRPPPVTLPVAELRRPAPGTGARPLRHPGIGHSR
jgi:hypothetical protein